MNVGWDQDQGASGVVEEEPGEYEADERAYEARGVAKGALARGRRGKTAEASRADKAVVMFGNAFAAKIIGTVGAAANRFAVRMMQTTLLGKGRHRRIFTEGRPEAAAGAGFADDG